MKIAQADRLKALPPYLFAELDRMKAEVAARGVDIISLGVGDPDLPTLPTDISPKPRRTTVAIVHDPRAASASLL